VQCVFIIMGVLCVHNEVLYVIIMGVLCKMKCYIYMYNIVGVLLL